MDLLKIEESSGTGDSLALRSYPEALWLEIDSPWSGDTQTGFGQSLSFTLSKDQALELASALAAWAKS